MNGRQLARAVAAHTGKDPKDVDEIIAGVTEVITAMAAKGEAVTIQGFAKFAVASRAARMGRNPRTGESIRIKASKRVRITPGKTLKDQALAPRTAPKLGRGVWPTDPGLLARQAEERRVGVTAANGTAAGAAKAVKKATTKKAPAKKTATPAKKVVRKAAAAKKAVAKRTPAVRQTTAKRAPAKRTVAKRGAARR